MVYAHLKVSILAFIILCLVSSVFAYAGSVQGWGNNGSGQATPPGGNNFIAIAAGGAHSLALKSDGSIVGWGDNGYGQAMPPDGNNFIAISAGEFHSLALKSDGSIAGWGDNWFGQTTPPAGNNFIAIAAGGGHSLALKSDGSIAGWGKNDYGQATPPDGNNFIAISAEGGISLALKSNGSIVGWGLNLYGGATPPDGNNFIAISAGYFSSLALKTDGSIARMGFSPWSQTTPPAGNNFIAIAVGGFHSLALKSDGSIIGWGNIKLPPTGNNFIAISAGVGHSLALIDVKPVAVAGPNQVVYAWIDGIAEVTLDANNSYDADGDALTYLWKWIIDGNTYETNEINPTIELPAGQYTFELVVNDGLEDSEPNQVVITVIEPIKSTLCIAPKVINRHSNEQRILAMLRLPAGITRKQLDPRQKLLLYPGEIESSFQLVLPCGQQGAVRYYIIAYFDKSKLMDAVGKSGKMQLDVVGQLKTDQYFYGSDTVWIINPPHRPPWQWRN